MHFQDHTYIHEVQVFFFLKFLCFSHDPKGKSCVIITQKKKYVKVKPPNMIETLKLDVVGFICLSIKWDYGNI